MPAADERAKVCVDQCGRCVGLVAIITDTKTLESCVINPQNAPPPLKGEVVLFVFLSAIKIKFFLILENNASCKRQIKEGKEYLSIIYPSQLFNNFHLLASIRYTTLST